MKSKTKTKVGLSMLALASMGNSAIVSLNFNSIGIETGSTTQFSNAGDVWRATGVRNDGGAAMDAIFTITSTVGTNPNNVEFVNETARGNNMRVRVGDSPLVTNASVFITINLVNAGTTDPYSFFISGDSLITQFSDLDSDASSDRSDFAGAKIGEFTSAINSNIATPGSSRLDLIQNPTFASGYTVGILKTPWGPQGNVSDTSPEAQAPVTAAFNFNPLTTINVVVGQRSNGGASANRHIDIDMTPDFVLIPEPSTVIMLGIGAFGLLRRRR